MDRVDRVTRRWFVRMPGLQSSSKGEMPGGAFSWKEVEAARSRRLFFAARFELSRQAAHNYSFFQSELLVMKTPSAQDLNAAADINHIHFGMNHYNGSNPHIAAGEKRRAA